MSIFKWLCDEYMGPSFQSPLELSDEIKNIVKEMLYGDNNVIRVNALAGTGKTTLLNILSKYYIARCEGQRYIAHFKEPNILYLAYSSRLKEEAKSLFDAKVTCNSIMELARKYTPRYENALNYSARNEYIPSIFMRYFNIEYHIAFEINEILNNWINSYDKEDGIENYVYSSKYFSESAIYAHTYVTDARCFYEGTYITDKFILKEFQLQLRQNQSATIGIEEHLDLLLVDEGQDLTDAALYIFLNFPAKKKVIVGDNNQKIYPHISTKNALLKEIDGSIEYYLTFSYRHSTSIANIATNILKMYKGNKHSIQAKQSYKIANIRLHAYIYRWLYGAIEGLLLAQKAQVSSLCCPDEVKEILEFILSLHLVDSGKSPYKSVKAIVDDVQKRRNIFNNEQSLVGYMKDDLPKELFKGSFAQANYILNKYDLETIQSIYEYLLSVSSSMLESSVAVMSVFKAKGFEFQTVTILSDMTDLSKVIADYFIKTEQIAGNGEKFKYAEFWGDYIYKNETIYNTSLVSKWTYPINLYYTAITRARDNVIDLSENRNYINIETLNKGIFGHIKKYKSKVYK